MFFPFSSISATKTRCWLNPVPRFSTGCVPPAAPVVLTVKCGISGGFYNFSCCMRFRRCDILTMEKNQIGNRKRGGKTIGSSKSHSLCCSPQCCSARSPCRCWKPLCSLPIKKYTRSLPSEYTNGSRSQPTATVRSRRSRRPAVCCRPVCRWA